MPQLSHFDYMNALTHLSVKLSLIDRLPHESFLLLNDFFCQVPKRSLRKPDHLKNHFSRYHGKTYQAQLNHIISQHYLAILLFGTRTDTASYIGESLRNLIWAPANLIPVPYEPTQVTKEFQEWGSKLDIASLITGAIGLSHAWWHEKILLGKYYHAHMRMQQRGNRKKDFSNEQVGGVSISAYLFMFLQWVSKSEQTYNRFVITYVQIVLARNAYLWGIVQGGLFAIARQPKALIRQPSAPLLQNFWWERSPDGRHLYEHTLQGFFDTLNAENPKFYAHKTIFEHLNQYRVLSPADDDLYSVYSTDTQENTVKLRGSALTDSDIKEWHSLILPPVLQ